MDNVATFSNSERKELFIETASKRGLNAQIIEKDFWVCWILKHLFELPDINEHLIFKGGTSLSKVFNVIERFSEDIDVAIDRKYLGFNEKQDLQNLSVKNRDKVVNELDEACKQVVQGEIFNSLVKLFKEILGKPSDNLWKLEIDEDDPYGQTILFYFPRESEEANLSEIDYIKPIVRIELGARPENQPIEIHKIQPYSAEEFPQLFENPSCEIKVLSAERTFWEKATILHDQYHRSADYKTADRISRHYYDFYKLAKTEMSEKAIENLDLLESVVVNKKSFFYRAGAKYDEVLIGELHLVPNDERINDLRRDYEKMNSMFFVEPPNFEDILQLLTEFEVKINSKFS